jgi:hypothetical protein
MNLTDQAVQKALQGAATDPQRTIDQLLRIIASQQAETDRDQTIHHTTNQTTNR